MKTFGLIWPDGTKEICSIVLDDEGNPRMDTLEPNPKPEDWQAPQVLPLVKLPKPEQGAWEPNVVWFEDRVERQWVAGTPPPAPTFTAEEWVAKNGITDSRPTTLLYLFIQTQQAGVTAPKLNALRAWLDSMIIAGVTAPSERRTAEAWGASPWTFEEASGEALSLLSTQQ